MDAFVAYVLHPFLNKHKDYNQKIGYWVTFS